MLRTTGTFSSRFPRASDVSLSFFGHVLAHEMLLAISSREPWWSEPGVGCHMGPVPSLDPENTRRSVCLPALEPRVHPLRPIRAETPQPLPTGSQPPPLHTGLCHLPPSPRSPPSQCSREPLPKAAPPLVSPAYFRVSQQRSGQARGREGLWTLREWRPRLRPGRTRCGDGRNGRCWGQSGKRRRWTQRPQRIRAPARGTRCPPRVFVTTQSPTPGGCGWL